MVNPSAKQDPEALLAAKLASLPTTPGCYLFIDKAGAVVYVGKAKSLRSRVRSYFQESGATPGTSSRYSGRSWPDLETVVTATEKEAAVLENELIKQHKPRFNVKLRDDKDFLCLKLDTQEGVADARDGPPARPGQGALFRALPLGDERAADAPPGQQALPAPHLLRYRDGVAPAPLPAVPDQALPRALRDGCRPGLYTEMVRSVALFLEGRHDELTGELTTRMRDASRELEFERAAIYRDQLRAVEAVREAQRVVCVKDVDQDVVGLYREGTLVEVEVILVRSGRVAEHAVVLAPQRGAAGRRGARRLPERVLWRRVHHDPR